MPLETEVKIKITNVENVRRRLRYLGYRVHARRVFESNLVLDTPDHRMQSTGTLLRLRRAGKSTILTYKGVSKPGKHKSREEIETAISNGEAIEQIVNRLGYQTVFRYDKYRTEYARQEERGIITVDETPIGTYLELEGAPEWIDETAREIGFCPADYITKSYGALYLEHCREHAVAPSHMMFPRHQGERLTGKTKSA